VGRISNEIRRRFPASPSGRAAVEIALYDLIGKLAGMPLYKMLGLSHEPLPVTSFTVGVEDVELAVARIDVLRKYPILKVKVGFGKEDDLLDFLKGVVGTVKTPPMNVRPLFDISSTPLLAKHFSPDIKDRPFSVVTTDKHYFGRRIVERFRQASPVKYVSVNPITSKSGKRLTGVGVFGEVEGRPFFAMEHLEGRSLSEYVKDRKPSWQELLGLAIQLSPVKFHRGVGRQPEPQLERVQLAFVSEPGLIHRLRARNSSCTAWSTWIAGNCPASMYPWRNAISSGQDTRRPWRDWMASTNSAA
jgi:hypothetical protein